MLMISREGSNGSGCLLVIGHHTQLENGLGLELPDSLTRDIDLTTDFREGQRLFTAETEPQLQNLLLAFVQLREPAPQMFLLDAAIHPLHRFFTVGIRDQFTQGAAIFLATGMGIQGCTRCALGDQILQFPGLDAHGTRQLQPIRLTTEAVGQLPGDATHLGELFADVDRQANGAGAVVDGRVMP